VSNSGYTCLITACYKNHPVIVARLLARPDVNPNWTSEEGDSLIMTCCARGYNEIISVLVEREDLDINFTGNRDLSPLMLACIEGNKDVATIILKRDDVDINIIGKDGVTAIGLACLQGDLDIVKMLLQREEIDINTQTIDGVTPFTVSIFKSHEEITKILLKRPDLELKNDEDLFLKQGIDPLHVAAAKGQVDIVRELVRFGCDVDRRRSESYTAIPVTMMKCSDVGKVVEIIDILLAAGCKPNMDNVKLAILRVPEVQEILFDEAQKPLSLMQLSRKSVWRNYRRLSCGRNIQPLLSNLKNEIPDTLLDYLKFKTDI